MPRLIAHFLETPLVESPYEARYGAYKPYCSEAMRPEPIEMCRPELSHDGVKRQPGKAT